MKPLSSLELKIIVIAVVSILFSFQSCEAQSSSPNHTDSRDEKKTVNCTIHRLCFIPEGYTLRIEYNASACTSNTSNLKWNFTQHNEASLMLTDGTGGFRQECSDNKHWLIKDNVTLLDSGTYIGFHKVEKTTKVLVEAVAAKLQWHLSDDATQVLVAINHSKIIHDMKKSDGSTEDKNITNSNCWYKQNKSANQFTKMLYLKAYILNVKDGPFDSTQLCCQFSVSNDKSETFSLAPDAALQFGQCNQTAPTNVHTNSSFESYKSESTTWSSSEMIKSSTFPAVALLILASSFY